MTPRCPQCGSIVYSRRNVLCGVCGTRLPDELLFSPTERKKVDRDLQVIKEREQETHRREAEKPPDYRMDVGGI